MPAAARFRLCELVITAIVASLAAKTAHSQEVSHVSGVGEVVEEWTPKRQLFVQGEVGLSEATLTDLAQWLGTHPNWTVYLTENCARETYRDADGNRYRGYRAVEHRLGKELASSSKFSQIVHGQTGLRWGAILYISFDRDRRHRKVGYFAQELYDRYSVGDAAWSGNLDRTAIRALKNGRRVYDAVTDTISMIDTLLARNRIREEEARARLKSEAQEHLAQAIAMLGVVTGEVDDLRERLPGAQGPLVRPDLTGWRSELEAIQSQFERGEIESTAERAKQLGDELRDFQALFARHDRLERDLERYQAELKEFEALPEVTQQPNLATPFRQAFTEVRDSYQNAELGGAEDLRVARRDLDSTRAWITGLRPQALAKLAESEEELTRLEANPLAPRETIRAAREEIGRYRSLDARVPFGTREIATKIQEIQTAIRRAEAKAQKRRQQWFGAVAAAFIGLAILLTILYFRARPSRRSARRLYERWKALLTAKTGRLWELEERRHAQLGEFGALSGSNSERRYAGQSLKIARQLNHLVGELFVLSSLARKHHASSHRLAFSGPAWRRWLRQFRRAPYQRMVARLSSERIVYDEESGLAAILAQEEKLSNVDALVADLDDLKPFRCSFETLIEAFNERAELALIILNHFEDALDRTITTLAEVDQRIGALERAIEKHRRLASDDLALALPAIEKILLPQLKSAYELAQTESSADPLTAIRRGATALARTGEAEQILLTFEKIRTDYRPRERRAFELLASEVPVELRAEIAPIEAEWIEARAQKIASAADQVLATLDLKPEPLVIGSPTQLREELASAGGSDRESSPPPSESDSPPQPLETIDSNNTPTVLGPNAWPFDKDHQELLSDAERAVDLDRDRRERLSRRLVSAHEQVARSRRELGDALALSPDQILREPDLDPDTRFTTVSELRRQASEALRVGRLEEAAQRIAEGHQKLDEAKEITLATHEAWRTFEERAAALDLEHSKIHSEIPPHQDLLAQHERDFAPEALDPKSGGEEYPGANDTFLDNIEETRTALSEAANARGEAERARDKGRLLESATLLDGVRQQLDLAAFRLGEIETRHRRVHALLEENRERLALLASTAERLANRARDRRTTERTLKSYQSAEKILATATTYESATPHLPYACREQLETLEKELTQVEHQVVEDWVDYGEAKRALEAARRNLTRATEAADEAARDDVPDSRPLLAARSSIDHELKPLLVRLEREFQLDHRDWDRLDLEARQVTHRATELRLEIQHQVSEGLRALQALEKSEAEVRRVRHWVGDYGIRVFGSPGLPELRRAEEELEAGHYQRCIEFAENARGLAVLALRRAKRRVSRKRSALAAQKRARSSLFTTGLSGGGISIGGSSFGSSMGGGLSSSSGFSSSGFSGGSSSGFSSSSW